MRLPSFPLPQMAPTLGQLRERLAAVNRSGWGTRFIDANHVETVADRLELLIAEREIAAGLRQPPTGRSQWGRLA